jgi:hypothetical protein
MEGRLIKRCCEDSRAHPPWDRIQTLISIKVTDIFSPEILFIALFSLGMVSYFVMAWKSLAPVFNLIIFPLKQFSF